MILAEMIHDVRIIPLDGRPHEDIRQWVGDSRGHWEGDMLMVETINFNGKRGWFGTPMTEGGGGKRPDEKMRVTERFTRTAPYCCISSQLTIQALTPSRGRERYR
jgi:hypothetical protein